MVMIILLLHLIKNHKDAGSYRRNIAKQSDEFGHPDKFCTDTEKSNWESCTVTCHDERVPKYIEKITKRSPYGGKTVTGGIVTAVDSSWLMSWTMNSCKNNIMVNQKKM